jgi:hypothetical protein
MMPLDIAPFVVTFTSMAPKHASRHIVSCGCHITVRFKRYIYIYIIPYRRSIHTLNLVLFYTSGWDFVVSCQVLCDECSAWGRYTVNILKNVWLIQKLINSIYDDMANLKYLGITVTNQNYSQEEFKNRFNSKNICYYAVKNILSSRVLSRNLYIKIYKYITYTKLHFHLFVSDC